LTTTFLLRFLSISSHWQQTAFLKPAPPVVKNGDILNVDEAAALLKVSKKTVYNRVKDNTIPYARLRPEAAVSPAKPGAVDR
jgi:excisionase family DNA binding protein